MLRKKVDIKKLIFAVSMIMIVACAMETMVFAFFYIKKDSFTFFDSEQYLLPEAFIKRAQKIYHPRWGWNKAYKTQFGERPRRESYGRPLIATFGDSFTYCYGVKDEETWQEYLSSTIKQDVYNFGVAAYGPDQAYLKFIDMYPKINVPVVIFTITTENIKRLVNVYRPFYNLPTGFKLTKPRFKVVRDELVLLENPVKNKDELMKLQDPRFINEIGRNDFWYNRDRYPVYQFPYSKILFNKRLWLETYYKISGRPPDDASPRPWSNLWEREEATDIMFRILKSFAAEAESGGAVPIIMVIPGRFEVTYKFARGEEKKNIQKIIEFCRENNLAYFNPVDGFIDYLKAGNEIDDLYKIHLKAKANEITAAELYEYLKGIIAFQ